MNIRPVRSRSDLKKFIELPYRLYRKDKVWVPPLRHEQFSQFDARRNPMLEHCEYELFLLEDQGEIKGRIASFTDHTALEAWKEPIGLFGYFECEDNPEYSRLLFENAADWLRRKAMKKMRGPWSFVSQEWGLVVEGFTPSPVVMAPYNPPYYIDHFVKYEFEKIKDLLVYYLSMKEGYVIPERILTLTDDVINRYGIRTRRIDMKRYSDEVETVIDLSNRSLINNWGYTAVSREEAEAVARDLRPVIQSRGVIFAENPEGRPVGFAITIPDVNRLLKGLGGRLFPLGWIRLLTGIPKLRSYRFFALGVIPEYHGKGVDSLLYRALWESLSSGETYVEINYVLEDNAPMNNAIRKLGAKPLRRYRVFEKYL